MASKVKSPARFCILQILLLAQLALGQQFRIGNHASKVNMPTISNAEAEAFIDRAFESMEQKFIKQGAIGKKLNKNV